MSAMINNQWTSVLLFVLNSLHLRIIVLVYIKAKLICFHAIPQCKLVVRGKKLILLGAN